MCPYRTPEERDFDYARRRTDALIAAQRQEKFSKWQNESKFFESHILQSINRQSHVASASLKQIALDRIQRRLSDPSQADLYFDIMSDILKYHSRLTVNFDFKKFVQSYNPSAQRLKNAFDFIVHPQHKTFEGYYAVDPQKRPFGYLQWRDQSEKALFKIPIHENTYTAQHTVDHVYLSSVLERQNFFASTRPIYGALDFTKSLYGAAPAYGKSFIVLRPKYKTLSTYTPSDSIYLADRPQTITSFDCLENIIGLLEPDHVFAKEKLFSALFEMARCRISGVGTAHNTFGKYDYIESQIHAKDLDYAECIAEVYIDKKACETMVKKPNLFTGDHQSQLIVKTHQVIHDMRDFCRQHKINFSFV